MLAIGRALMGNPRVAVDGQPSEGLAPLIVAEVGRTLLRLKREGQSILLVEQNIKLALDLADEVVILNTGRVAFKRQCSPGAERQALITQHSRSLLTNRTTKGNRPHDVYLHHPRLHRPRMAPLGAARSAAAARARQALGLGAARRRFLSWFDWSKDSEMLA